MDPISSCFYFIPPQAMEKHRDFLKKHCRLCGKNLKRKGREYGKELFEAVLSEKVHVNIANDTPDVHPQTLCAACKAKLYRLSSLNEEDEAVVGIKKGLKVFNWKPHAEDGDCLCQSFTQRGRPSKRARLEEDQVNSSTESANETESDTEKDGCLAFSKLMCMLPTLDRELAVALSEKLSEQFNFLFIDLDDIRGTIDQLSKGTLLDLTDCIFRTQAENVRKDIARNLPGLLTLQPENWMEARNDVLSCAINALSHNSIKMVQKSVAVDQLYSLVQPTYVSPFMFAANLLVYSIARSKLATNIYAHILPAGGSSSLRMWLNRLTMEVLKVPSGDVLTAIDNDQVLIKKWTVRKDNRAQISVLTSVCVTEIDPAGVAQKQKSLAPRYSTYL